MDSRELLRNIRRRTIDFVPARKVVSPYPGEWPSPFEGKGFEPLRFRDYEIGDDPRRVNLPATLRRGTPTIVERVALRDLRMVVVVDRSPSMVVRDKLRTQLTAASLLLYAGWQAETTFGLAVQSDGVVKNFGLGIGSRHFYHLYRILWNLFLDEDNRRTRGATKPLARSLPPNAMLLYCSDFLDRQGALMDLDELFKAVRRYDFIPVVIQDDVEYSFPILPFGTFVPFSNPETGEWEEVWTSPKEASEIRAVHETRFRELRAGFVKRGIHMIHIESPDAREIAKQVDVFFRKRKRR